MSLKKCSVLFVFFAMTFNAVMLHGSEKIKVAFGDALAPWVMPEMDEGIIVEIIEHALEPLGYTIEKVYLPYARRLKSYEQGLVDVSSDINANTMKERGLEGFLADTAYTYVNYAYSLNKRNYQFKSIQDLGDYRLLSWQGAIAHLSNEYAQMAKNNPLYSERHDQSIQVKMLFLERVDVIQMDEQIFNYFRAQVGSHQIIDTTLPVDRFGFFGESPNSFIFRTEKLKDEFNEQLSKLKSTGKYAEILAKYSALH